MNGYARGLSINSSVVAKLTLEQNILANISLHTSREVSSADRAG